MINLVRRAYLAARNQWNGIHADRGATVIEYALMALGGIAIAAILVAAITAFTNDHSDAIRNTK